MLEPIQTSPAAAVTVLNPLEWQAFLYVAGELAPDAETTFEALLAESQPAREAVVAAVQLRAAIAAAEPPSAATIEPARSSTPPPAQRHAFSGGLSPKRYWTMAWRGVLVASAAAVVAAICLSRTHEVDSVPSPWQVAANAHDLALRWSQWNNLTDSEPTKNDLAAAAPSDEAAAGEGLRLAPDGDEEVAPKWLLSAVAPAM
ncbi:MAG TPA: hypothetical protein VFE24_07935 [Pirellulales bacterium]|jgi:anti-sigma-K factor RskA|nr:hypothetical protein [Pirellulales bacterium]